MTGKSYSPEEIKQFARAHFHITCFREQQLEIIKSLLNKKDTIVVMPTGGGKSITFQIPALMREGLALVVSPLISLMKDQVRILKEEKNIIGCDYLSSNRPYSEIKEVYGRIDQIKILYVTPERLENQEFIKFLRSKNLVVSMIIVDEAHCISLWGNTFRPSYLKLKAVKNNFPDAVVGAFTATATPEIINDIIFFLGLKEPVLFRKSMRRDNIFISISFIQDKFLYLLKNIQKDQFTIIYTTSKYLCDSLVYLLESHGYSAAAYHAGLPSETRNKNQNDFMEGRKKIMVATSAFGMGIDKKDVRHIIHFQAPLELEEYLQEIGRAGRDGKAARADLLAGLDDFNDLASFLNDQYPPWDTVRKWLNKNQLSRAEKERLESIFSAFGDIEADELKKSKDLYLKKKKIRMNKLNGVTEFLSSSACRMVFLMKYFGEKATHNCGHCDYCISKKDKGGLNQDELRISALLFSINKSIIINNLKDIGSGVKSNFTVFPGFGKLKGISIQNYREILYSLKNKGIIEFDKEGKAVLYNKKNNQISLPHPSKKITIKI